MWRHQISCSANCCFEFALISASWINTQNMTNPTIVSPVKMEYGWNFSISGQKMMVKSGIEKIFLKFLHAGDNFPLLHKSAQNNKFSNKNNYLPPWRDFKINFSIPLFTIIFRPKMAFMNQSRRVNRLHWLEGQGFRLNLEVLHA